MSSAALHVVALGGGAGLAAMMRGIAEAFFHGGRSWNPPDDHDRLSSVCFGGHDDVGTQRLGSLILTSLNDLRRDFHWAVERVGDPTAREAIAAADLIVLGPGSVYTNLLPVLLVREIAEEIGRSRARVVLVMNLMTEPGGMDGYVASDCVRAIQRHAPEVPIHDVLLNDAPIRSDRVVNCARWGALPIGYDTEALEALGCRPLKCDLLWDGPVVRHDPRKMGRALLGLVADVETRNQGRPRVRAAQCATEAFV
jgi:2-phospho-L-lactate transferase CofD-like protein